MVHVALERAIPQKIKRAKKTMSISIPHGNRTRVGSGLMVILLVTDPRTLVLQIAGNFVAMNPIPMTKCAIFRY